MCESNLIKGERKGPRSCTNHFNILDMSGGTQIPLDFIILQKISYKKDIFEIRELTLKYRDLYTKDQNIIEENGYMYTSYF